MSCSHNASKLMHHGPYQLKSTTLGCNCTRSRSRVSNRYLLIPLICSFTWWFFVNILALCIFVPFFFSNDWAYLRTLNYIVFIAASCKKRLCANVSNAAFFFCKCLAFMILKGLLLQLQSLFFSNCDERAG